MSNTQLRIDFEERWGLFVFKAFLIEDIEFICTSFIRTAEEQNKLFKDGKSKCDGYIKISFHQKARARDLVIIKDGKATWKHTPEYDKLGEIWESMGGKWGGSFKGFKDIFHFQY